MAVLFLLVNLSVHMRMAGLEEAGCHGQAELSWYIAADMVGWI